MTLHRWLQPLDSNKVLIKNGKRKVESSDLCPGLKKPRSDALEKELVLADASRIYNVSRIRASMETGEYAPTEHLRLKYLDRTRLLAEFQLQSVPYSLTALQHGNKAWTFVGLDNGDVTVLSMGRESVGELVADIPGLHASAVRDMDTSRDSLTLLSCSDVGVALADLESNSVLSTHQPGQEAGYRHCKFLSGTSQYFTGTKSGSIYVMDTRTSTPAQTIKCQSKRRNFQSAQTTCAIWYDSKTLATATNANETVRYWDLRKTRIPVNEASPTPYRVEQGQTVERRPSGVARGIASLTKLSENGCDTLYALGRRGHVWSSSRWSKRSGSILIPETVDAPTYHSKIVSFEINGYDFLATSGSRGVSVLPTLNQQTVRSNMTSSASRLLEEAAAAATGLHWDESSRTLLSTGDDQLCRFWAMP